jgi:hypothetical protein
MVESHRPIGQSARSAEDRHPFPFAVRGFARQWRGGRVEDLVTRDQQVKLAIPIVIQEGATGAPLLCGPGGSTPRCDVLKAAVTTIAIENIESPIRDIKIRITVVIDISDAYSGAPAGTRQASLLRDVLKPASTSVAIEVIRLGRGAAISFEAASVYEKEIQPAIIIEVDKSDPGAVGFDDVLLGRLVS